MALSKIIICSGEPAGIGPDIVIKAAQQGFDATLAVVGDPNLLRDRAELLGIALDINGYESTDKSNSRYLENCPRARSGRVSVIPLEVSTPVTPGKLDSKKQPVRNPMYRYRSGFMPVWGVRCHGHGASA